MAPTPLMRPRPVKLALAVAASVAKPWQAGAPARG